MAFTLSPPMPPSLLVVSCHPAASRSQWVHRSQPPPDPTLISIPHPITTPIPIVYPPHLQMRQRVKAIGLLPVLENLTLDSDEVIAATAKFCGEHGVRSKDDLVEVGLLDDFVTMLRLKTVSARRLKVALQSTNLMASQLSRRGERPASSRPQVPQKPIVEWQYSGSNNSSSTRARWQCALTGFLPPLVTA